MNRILVVQTAYLGDVVLTTPLLREIRRARPEARIAVVTTPLGAQALEQTPFADEIVVFDKRGRDRGARGTWRLVNRLRRERFDLAIAAQRSFRTGVLVRGAGAPERAGFAGSRGAWAYTTRIPWRGGEHAVRRYLALAAAAGGDPAAADPRPEIAVGDTARERAASLLRKAGIGPAEPLLALAPGSVWGTKRWVPEGYVEAARAAAGWGLRVVLVGSPDERDLCGTIADAAGAVTLAGRTTVPELAALFAGCRALLTNDSGPGHLAAAVGTPVVAVFGPTVPAFGYAPFGDRHRIVEHPDLDCRPCHTHGPRTCPLGHHRCMRELPAARVIAALDDVLSRGARPARPPGASQRGGEASRPG